MLVALVLFAVASVFVYSLPGLVWFALAVPIWLALELGTGRLRIDVAAAARRGPPPPQGDRRRGGGRGRRGGALRRPALRVRGQGRRRSRSPSGRLNSPVFPGEALGIWPEGDFQVVRGEVEGAYPAVALGLLAAAIGGLAAVRRRDFGLVAVGAAAVLVYAGARLFASIYVEAKALAVIAPLVVVAALGALLAPRLPGAALTTARYALGVVVAVALAGSTFLALRAAPVGFDQRGDELEGLAGLVRGRTVAFLGVDRFAGYWLRGTLMRSPGGYVPAEVKARPKKVWQQGLAMDLDTLAPRRLDDFDYAITTRAAYQSTAAAELRDGGHDALLRALAALRADAPAAGDRQERHPGPRPRLHERGRAAGWPRAPGAATVIREPVTGGPGAWSRGSPFDAPDGATQSLDLGPGRWRLSLQYHSQAPLTVSAPGSKVELPPSLDGMYLTHQGQGAFWPAGEVRVTGRRPGDGHGGRRAPEPAAARPGRRAEGLAGDAGRHPARAAKRVAAARRLRAVRGPLHARGGHRAGATS